MKMKNDSKNINPRAGATKLELNGEKTRNLICI